MLKNKLYKEDINSMCISYDGKYLVAGSDDRSLKIYDLNELPLNIS